MLKSIKKWVQGRLRRKPQVFIMPTINGWWWLGTLFLLLLIGWGYANNLVLALAVLLCAFTLVLLLEAHFNMHGIRLQRLSIEDQYALEGAAFKLTWTQSFARHRQALEILWDEDSAIASKLATEHHWLLGMWIFPKRGYWSSTFVRLTSSYPLGLFRTWSYHRLDAVVWIYPPRLPGPVEVSSDQFEGETVRSIISNTGEEPAGLRRYQDGDSLSRVVWKSLARGRDLHSMELESEASAHKYFTWPSR
ncbi:MAG: DUF58 domain-containing protein, partial [Bacteroidota bacterium]